jgi:hypothetical protein
MTEISYVCKTTLEEIQEIEKYKEIPIQMKQKIDNLMQESFDSGMKIGLKLVERRIQGCVCKEK